MFAKLSKWPNEREVRLNGGWVDAVKNKEAARLVPNGLILLVALPFEAGQGLSMK
jgi:hypothetical protein